jgi:hypothetical protein
MQGRRADQRLSDGAGMGHRPVTSIYHDRHLVWFQGLAASYSKATPFTYTPPVAISVELD